MKAAFKTKFNTYRSSGAHSTLLIPRKDWGLFQRFLADSGSRRLMLQSLISQFAPDIAAGRFEVNSKKARTKYQEPGQDLIRFDFNPFLESWIQLGQLAAGMGISRCKLFILLLKAEYKKLKLTGQRPVDPYAHIGSWLDQLSREPVIRSFNRIYEGQFFRGVRYWKPPP